MCLLRLWKQLGPFAISSTCTVSEEWAAVWGWKRLFYLNFIRQAQVRADEIAVVKGSNPTLTITPKNGRKKTDHCELNPSGICEGAAQVDSLAGIRRHLWFHLHPLTRRPWEKQRNGRRNINVRLPETSRGDKEREKRNPVGTQSPKKWGQCGNVWYNRGQH